MKWYKQKEIDNEKKAKTNEEAKWNQWIWKYVKAIYY